MYSNSILFELNGFPLNSFFFIILSTVFVSITQLRLSLSLSLSLSLYLSFKEIKNFWLKIDTIFIALTIRISIHLYV